MVEDRFTASLLALGSWLSRVGGRLMAPLGLSQHESVILLGAVERGPLSQKELRTDLLLERSNVSKAVLHLESMGLLATAPSPADARAVLVRATPAGEELARRCSQVYQDWNRRWLGGIEGPRLAEVERFLQELRRRDPAGEQ
jgi:DNA-binding MarR family transcriptional regulator